MNKSETIGALAKALSLAQSEMSGAKKGASNPFFKSKYSDLASVMEAIRGPLAEHGLAFVQTTRPSEGNGLIVETTLMHESGEWIAGELFVPAVKADPQSFGSALSYGRRYALQAIVGLESVDDDGEAAHGRGEPQNGGGKATKPPATQSKPQQQQTPGNGEPPSVRGIIEEVSVKTGSNAKGPWTRYGIKINGEWYGTFSSTIGSSAESLQGSEVVLSYSDDGKNKTIIEIVPVAI